MYAVINVETGDFYSESPALKNEARKAGKRWDCSSILPAFARRYAHYQDALRRSQKLSDSSDCIYAVMPLA